MIRPLRSRHRWMIGAVALIVPPLYVLGLMDRTSIPVETTLAPEIARSTPEPSPIVWRETAELADLTIEATLHDSTPPGLDLGLTVSPAGARPDLLVYWQSRELPVGSRPGEQAYLLGALGGAGAPGRFLLPAAAATEEGRVLLYSLAHQENAASLDVPAGSDLIGSTSHPGADP